MSTIPTPTKTPAREQRVNLIGFFSNTSEVRKIEGLNNDEPLTCTIPQMLYDIIKE